MNWKRFLPGLVGRKDNGHEDEMETDDEEITESDDTASAEKKQHFLGISFRNFSYKRFSKRCMKLTFLTVNGATFIAGIVAIVTSVWMFADSKIMSRLLGQRLFVTTLLFMGIVASFVALIGIIGLVRRRRKFLNVYITCNSFFLCIIFICAILSFWLFEQVTKKIQEDMTSSIESYSSWARESWDNTHRYLKCCGIKSFKDWAKYRFHIPQSCCSKSIGQCFHMSEDVAYKSGCLKSAVLLLKSYIYTINISTLLLSLFLILSVILALVIRSKLKRRRSERN